MPVISLHLGLLLPDFGYFIKMTIQVLYDISILGIHYRDQKSFGISRSTESLLSSLLTRPDLSIAASSDLTFNVWYYAHLFLTESDFGDRLPWFSNSFNAQIRDRLTQVLFKEEKFAKFVRFLQRNQRFQSQEFLSQLYHLRSQLINYQFSGTPSRNLATIDIYHSAYYPIPKQVKRHKKIRSLLTIHDLIPILHPEWCGMLGNDVKYFHPEFNLPKTLATIDPDTWIVCPSETTKNDLCNHLGHHLDPTKVFVTPWGVSNHFQPCQNLDQITAVKQKYNIPDVQYLLCLSTLEPRKNVDGVIRAFREAIKQEKIHDLAIVMAGALGWQYEPIFREAHRFPRLAPRIIFTGSVAEADLAALYSGALMFVYPSLYEGFGLPPLEAMRCGTPVITSNSSSLPEVVGDAALLVDPTNEVAIADCILQLYQSSQLRETLTAKSLQRAQDFSWDRCVEKTINVYHQALNSSKS